MLRLNPLFASAVAAVLFASVPVLAQGVSPGPLAEGHASLDRPDKCTSCHQLSGKTAFATCTSCHTHKPLAEALDKGHGLHFKVRDRACETCHTEHKGRDGQVADWSKVGGQTSFDHKQTGFVLKGMHEKVKCTACHKRTTKSGWILFAGLEDNCDKCHKNPHNFTDAQLRTECLKCHIAGGIPAKQLKPQDVPFDHAQVTGVALVGKHATVQCVKCHEKNNFSMATIRTCKNCHKNPHVGSQSMFVAKNQCPVCHDPGRKFQEPHFDHSTTAFPLWGPHARQNCRSCHNKVKPAPTADCNSCHKGTHKDRFAALKCNQCHTTTSDKIVFNHGEVTKFTLTAKHTETKCRSCHRGAKPFIWEKFEWKGECRVCHKHTNAHNNQFDDKQCLNCHLEGGNKKLTFDHNKDSKFALVGIHAQLAADRKCKACHEKGLYRNGKGACLDCHKDVHNGTLGTECSRCHTPEVKFKKTKFDHNTVKTFKLEGLHLEVDCEKCHPGRVFKTGKTRCIDCHATTEPHAKKLGTNCDQCHTPVKKAPLFKHEEMTKFARVGTHLEVPCTACHRDTITPPPKVGWVKAIATEKLDLHFPVMGNKCVQCHHDQHSGANGTECDSCHKVTAFKDVSVSVHDTGAFRLGGKHATIPCARCHGGGKLLAGTGEACVLCHRDDDPHANALGPNCGDCHHQSDWIPSGFQHAQTAFPLLGRHRTVSCRTCHGQGQFVGLPTDCFGCHAPMASRVPDPIHTLELQDCASCHSPIAFRPARFTHPAWPDALVGNHRRVQCSSCHLTSYAGTPQNCENCHITRYYDARLVPTGYHHDHETGTVCADCHTPVGWIPARKP